jgi:hypothetical protein
MGRIYLQDGAKMKCVGETLDYDGNFINVWECEDCKFRMESKEDPSCRRCVRSHHIEEAQAGKYD